MKKIYMALAVALLSAGVFSVKAQDTKKEMDDKYVENDVVSLAGKKGFSFSTKAGDFLFKPYALVQASACYNRYDALPPVPSRGSCWPSASASPCVAISRSSGR